MCDSPEPDQPSPPAGRNLKAWPWLALAAALLAAGLIRIPLAANVRTHMDSDLAVDGITMMDALHGHFRWHYPATPAVGTASLALTVPAGAILGPTPDALAAAGLAIYGLFMVATFLLALRVFGRGVAAWSLIPLAFASTGTIWLSGRITGGHLLTAAWHAGAFLLLYLNITRGGPIRAAALGLWCGLGLWNDSMFAMTLVGLIPVGVAAWIRSGGRRRGLALGLIVVAAAGIGLTPKLIGSRVDSWDAYSDTFSPSWKIPVLLDHLKILSLDCLPRLIIGHRVPNFEAEPGGVSVDGTPIPARSGMTDLGAAAFLLGFGFFVVGVPGLAVGEKVDPARADKPAGPGELAGDAEPDADESERQAAYLGAWAVRWGLLITCGAMLAAFVVNRNIYNSDNYRYLVFLLVPWAIGFGRVLDELAKKGLFGTVSAGVLAFVFATVFTLDSIAWYRNLGWFSDRGRILVRTTDDPVLDWLDAHPHIDGLHGGYWEVYRYTFLTGGRVRGVPMGIFPNRFPEWSTPFPNGRPQTILTRFGTRTDQLLRRSVYRGGGEVIARFNDSEIWDWPASAVPRDLPPDQMMRRR
jgi:hypothetical protein